MDIDPVCEFSDHIAAVKAVGWSPHQHGTLASGGGTADRYTAKLDADSVYSLLDSIVFDVLIDCDHEKRHCETRFPLIKSCDQWNQQS